MPIKYGKKYEKAEYMSNTEDNNKLKEKYQ